MFKRALCLVLSLMMILLVTAVKAEDSASALTLAELKTWAENYKTRAMEVEPINDPAAPESNTEDGYMFLYEFATLYMDRPEMTADSQVQCVVLYSGLENGPRETRVDMTAQEILDAYYTENPDLVGNRDGAVVYQLNLMPQTAQAGVVHRDGQRLQTIEYTVYEQLATGGDGYSNAGVIYTLNANNVTAIRVYGLVDRCGSEDVDRAMAELETLSQEMTYSQVQISFVGTDLDKFQPDDLAFSGLDFADLAPDSAIQVLGLPLEDQWMEDGQQYLRLMSFPTCEIVFSYDANQENPQVESLLIDMATMEGPRSLRVGDTFASVLNRFRHSEGQHDGVDTEVLYGTEESGEFGVATYGMDGTTLRYGLKLGDKKVVMNLYFTMNTLTEIFLYAAE